MTNGERQSINTQRDFATRYCALHELPIHETYADDGVSGTVPLQGGGNRSIRGLSEGGDGNSNQERGDPLATPDAILKIVDAEDPPLRFALGSTLLPTARAVYKDRIATWEAWEDISNAAQGGMRSRG